MTAKKTWKAKKYAMHGHVEPKDQGGKTLDYDSFFFTERDRLRRHRIKSGEDIIAIVNIYHENDTIAYRFIRTTDDKLTIFDTRTGDAEEASTEEWQKAAVSTWMICRKGSRFVYVDSRRPSVGIRNIERFLVDFGRTQLGYDHFSFTLNPVTTESFVEEIEKFIRIREVRVQISRPNRSWESIKSLVPDVADSNASVVEMTTKAGRNQSLEKDKGIVQRVKTLTRNPLSGLKNVFVLGKVPNSAAEKQITMSESQRTVSAELPHNAAESTIVRALIDQVENDDSE